MTAADLVTLPDRRDIPVAAVLGANGASAPRQSALLALPAPAPGMLGVRVDAGIGDYRAGDEIWCETLAPDAFAAALNQDVLVPRPVGRFIFARLINREAPAAGDQPGKLHLLPLGTGTRQQVVSDPPWIARAVTLVRRL